MTKVQNHAFKLAATFFLLFSLSFVAMPKEAEAITVQVKNPYSQTMQVALVMFNDARNTWLVKGWYSVSPNSTRNLSFSSSTKQNNMYIHAHTSEASWGSERKYTVISGAFEYVAGQTCPSGDGRRQVGFDRWYAENNGYIYWKP